LQDVAAAKGVRGAAHTIGSAWGDLDNDGLLDLFVANFAHTGQEQSHFYKNNGPDGDWGFTDMSATAKLKYQESYGSPALADYDNDNDFVLYLFTVNLTDTGRHEQPVLYSNDRNCMFTNVTACVSVKFEYHA